MSSLPPCGLYRTTAQIGDVPAGRLVYFHNHGNPGPGVYFPESWAGNRAKFAPNGTTLPTGFDPRGLTPLPAEGFYRVISSFFCCEKQCMKFEPDMFVQLGYNGTGKALLFMPEIGTGVIDVPERGSAIDDAALKHLAPLKLAERKGGSPEISLPRGIVVH